MATLRQAHLAAQDALKVQAQAEGWDLGDFIAAYTAMTQDKATYQFAEVAPPARYGIAFVSVYADETLEEAIAATQAAAAR